MRYRCILCGRDKFTRPYPHNCSMGFLKHYNRSARLRGLETIWEVVSHAQADILQAGP